MEERQVVGADRSGDLDGLVASRTGESPRVLAGLGLVKEAVVGDEVAQRLRRAAPPQIRRRGEAPQLARDELSGDERRIPQLGQSKGDVAAALDEVDVA